jgi:DNA-binding transcriptional LysR family regulator
MRVLGLRIGFGAAFVTALLPVLVALLHLLPPAVHVEPKAHHHHAAHVGLVHGQAHAAVEYQAPDTPRDGESRSKIGHCPLCLWLQGFHALPAPDAIAAPVAGIAVIALPWHAPAFVAIRVSVTAQPRAPPVSLPA